VSSTRLLVLGVVRILQPVHGYDVRRELLSWQAADWMNVQPGSIYSALKTMERDGLLAVESHERPSGRPERTRYVLTAEGDREFLAMLRQSWWNVARAPDPVVPALCLMSFMSRAELVDAQRERLVQLDVQVGEMAAMRALIRDGATGAEGDIPEHVREVADFATSRLHADIAWTKQFLERLEAGAYWFEGEPLPPLAP
jgi:DNA-binding PadR family transcriptional regulator